MIHRQEAEKEREREREKRRRRGREHERELTGKRHELLKPQSPLTMVAFFQKATPTNLYQAVLPTVNQAFKPTHSMIGAYEFLPLHARMFPGLIVCRSYTGKHRCCEFISTALLLSQKVSVSLCSCLPSGLYTLSTQSSAVVPEL